MKCAPKCNFATRTWVQYIKTYTYPVGLPALANMAKGVGMASLVCTPASGHGCGRSALARLWAGYHPLDSSVLFGGLTSRAFGTLLGCSTMT
eukprot:5597682-Amphidinium_carterae.1